MQHLTSKQRPLRLLAVFIVVVTTLFLLSLSACSNGPITDNDIAVGASTVGGFTAKQIDRANRLGFVSTNKALKLLDELQEIKDDTVQAERLFDLCGDNFACVGTQQAELEQLRNLLTGIERELLAAERLARPTEIPPEIPQ